MKKLLLSAALVAASLTANAEGYQVNTLSTKQTGMGHTGTALKLGAESMLFNPAGMAFMDNKIDFSGSFTAILPSASATNCSNFSMGQTQTFDGTFDSDNPASTPININLGFSIYDNLKAGVTFYTPYGSGINWTENWPGALLNQKVKLAVYTVQPTIAWRITPKLSVGAGMTIGWGSVNLDKGLVSGAMADMLLMQQGMPGMFGDIVPASVNLKGTSQIALGFNVGAMYDITDQWTVGASYRSKMSMKVKAGTASVSYANELAKGMLENQLGLIDQANFSAEMPCVSILSLGVGYKPITRLTLAFDAQLSFWKQYKQLDIEFAPEQLSVFDQHIVKNYRNAWMFHLGAQYELTDRFDLRAGLILDTTPVRKDNFNPETPGMTKLEPSVGLSFRPVKNFSIDASVLYVAGLGRDGASCEYANMLTGQMDRFTADYSVSAWCPSIGVSLSF
ncbi:MAG: outer membrane protein transport protein [Muribaculaceae bacterium]|nr:outer membrane protein transport protein [Muribaculaceae bacterium]